MVRYLPRKNDYTIQQRKEALSVYQREMLVSHVPGMQPIDQRVDPATNARFRTITILVRDGLVKYDRDNRYRPTATYLTDLGREVAAAILADYAEALVEAGALEALPPIVIGPAGRIKTTLTIFPEDEASSTEKAFDEIP